MIKLEQNYRSTGNILAASQKIINQNKTRTEKTLFTEAGAGNPITIESLVDEVAEATYVARQIERLKVGKSNKYSDLQMRSLRRLRKLLYPRESRIRSLAEYVFMIVKK